MYEAQRVRTLYTRRRRLLLAAADMERRAAVIQTRLAEVDAELRTMVLFVPAPRRNAPAAVLARDLLDLLRSSDRALTTREVMLWVVERKGLPDDDPSFLWKVQQRVWATLDRLAKQGVVRVEAESRRVVRWKMV